MRYSVERRDGTWFEHELLSREDSESAAVIADIHKSPHIELAWLDKEGRAATHIVYRVVYAVSRRARTVKSLTNEIERIRQKNSSKGA